MYEAYTAIAVFEGADLDSLAKGIAKHCIENDRGVPSIEMVVNIEKEQELGVLSSGYVEGLAEDYIADAKEGYGNLWA